MAVLVVGRLVETRDCVILAEIQEEKSSVMDIAYRLKI